MKKTLSLLVVSVLVLGLFVATGFAAESIKMGKADFAAHGTKCFTVAVVALQGDTIVGAYLDEYQFQAKDKDIGVPNSDKDFGKNFANPDQVLGSKKVNTDLYSANMAKAGSTVSIKDNFVAIEKFVTGKTISELEAILTEKDETAMVDAITGATVVDAKGYVTALFYAAIDAMNN